MIYDIAIIGAGPGGYVAALRARQLGFRVCLIEKDKPGGVCLNRGCIPSKALIHQAELFNSISDLEAQGLSVDLSKWDYSRVVGKAREAAERLSSGVRGLLRKSGVDVIPGVARLTGNSRISVDGQEKPVTARNIIIATGSRPREIPGFPLDGEQFISSDEALFLKELPRRITIIGGGAIGCELGFVFRSFGAAVTILEMMDSILPRQDSETASHLAKELSSRGIDIRTGITVSGIQKNSSSVALELKSGDETGSLATDLVIVATGRTPNTDELGLEDAGVRTDRGYVITDGRCRTSVPGIFAIGDILTTPQLAHVASREAEIAVEMIAGMTALPEVDITKVPYAVYTVPEVAGFGWSEEQLRSEGRDFRVGRFPYQGIGRAVAQGHSSGWIKTLVDSDTGEVLGAHIVGHHASEIVHELLLARNSELLDEDITRMIHAHPTLSEGLREAILAAGGEALHV